jgi:hypothetical protein
MLKYTRSSGNAAAELPLSVLDDEQLKQLKAALVRHAKGGKILPYSDEFRRGPPGVHQGLRHDDDRPGILARHPPRPRQPAQAPDA